MHPGWSARRVHGRKSLDRPPRAGLSHHHQPSFFLECGPRAALHRHTSRTRLGGVARVARGRPTPMSAFEELGVSPELIRAADEQGWLLPTPVQAEAVPLVLGGGDVLAAAETGSGKTGAFGLPALQLVHELLRRDAVRAAAPTAPPTSGGAAARAPSSAPPRPRPHWWSRGRA